MIALLRKFNFHFVSFLSGGPRFLLNYIRSRRMFGLFPAAFAILSFICLILVFARADRDSYRESMHSKYRQLTQQAVSNSDPAADVYFSKLLQLSNDPQEESFLFAKQLYEESSELDDLSPQLLSAEAMNAKSFAPAIRRSLTIMNSLAPLRWSTVNCPPAHEFLAHYWRTRKPQTETIQVLAMQHDVFADLDNIEPAIAFAKRIQTHNYHATAIEILNRHRHDSEVLLLLAVSHSKTNDLRSANKCLKQAENLLRTQLAETPSDTSARLNLSRCIATQSRILESMFVLVEGYSHDGPTELVDQLIQRYTIWLQLMPHDKATLQLADIDLAMKYGPDGPRSTDEETADKFGELSLSTGQRFTLPAPIVRLHELLTNGQGQFLAPLLLGTEKVIRQEHEAAVVLLEQAYRMAPDHPVIANNLAWTLYRKLQSDGVLRETAENRNDNEQTARVLERAFELSSTAVAACPDIISFRATKGIIAAQLSKWKTAIQELKRCVDFGEASAEVRAQLENAERQLQRSSLPEA